MTDPVLKEIQTSEVWKIRIRLALAQIPGNFEAISLDSMFQEIRNQIVELARKEIA